MFKAIARSATPHARRTLRPHLSALAVVAMLAACASPQPMPYAGLQSAPLLRPSGRDDSKYTPYRLSRQVNWARYGSVIVDPVTIYQGPDQQFEDVSDADKDTLAADMQRQFTDALKSRFNVATAAAPGTLRIRLTLTGAKTTTRGVSTLSRFDLAGGPYNAVQAARGREGALTGSVSFAVELLDSGTNELLGAYVTKQYPNAWNLGATLGALDAAQVGIKKGAQDLLAQLK